ncbi:MAG: LamB/YcsF family protein [Anaerolineae bacterium]|nr:LamB/YcsF family protein [Anaerolineae bacterium]
MHIDLNCDMGESYGRYTLGEDAPLMHVITSSNIACGFHAGDPEVMAATVQMAVRKGVAVGAHPGYPDLQGFGRREMSMTHGQITAAVLYQLGALAGFVHAAGSQLVHVKPHGALYNTAARDARVAQAIVDAVYAFDPHLVIVTLPHSTLQKTAEKAGLTAAREGFADRAYQSDGSLLPRSQPGAVIHNVDHIAARAVQMVTRREVESVDGTIIPLELDTLCVHGDTPGALHIAQKVRSALEMEGINLSAMHSFLQG